MRAQVVHRKLVLPIVDAVSKWNSNAIVGRLEVTNFVPRHPQHGTSFDIALPDLRKDLLAVAVPNEANTTAHRAVPEGITRAELMHGHNREPGFMDSSLIRVINEAFGHQLPGPELARSRRDDSSTPCR